MADASLFDHMTVSIFRIIQVTSLAVAGLSLIGCAGPEGLLRTNEIASDSRGQPQEESSQKDSEIDILQRVDDPNAVWQFRRQQLLEKKQWRVFGKLAVRAEGRAWTTTFQWRQMGDDYLLRLSGPFGGGLQVASRSQRVEVKTADDRTFYTDDPEQVLFEQVGWRVPISGLRYWILGRVEPNKSAKEVYIDVAGRLSRFKQSDWFVRYVEYQDVDEFAMPRKASLESGQVKASVLLTRWEFSPNS